MKTWKAKIIALIILMTLILPAHPVSAAGSCDWAQFVSDISVPDGSAFNGGTIFTKTWRLKNIGSCTWTTAYSLVFSGGEQMGGPVSVSMPYTVAPNQMVDISVTLTAPANPGSYRGFWKFRNPNGALFGIGKTADGAIWVDIRVNAALAVIYDFTADVCSALWAYDGGPVTCPHKESQSRFGTIIRMDNPILETGLPAGQPSLLTIPQQKNNGWIRGVYPKQAILPGDHFQADIGCENGAVSCYVTFSLEYLTPDGQVETFWKFRHKYDGKIYHVDIDLSRLYYKKNIKLILTVFATGSAKGDRALWIKPVIVRPSQTAMIQSFSAAEIPLATPSPTSNASCDRAIYVTDVSVPDNTSFASGAGFTKTWRLQNSGTCTWTTGYSLVYSSGEKMSGLDSIALPAGIAPNQTVDVSANFTAPATMGTYQGFWILKNASGQTFGIGPNADSPIWVKINVTGTPVNSVTGSGYDFAENACSAQWYSNGGLQPCPGTDGNPLGFVLKQISPRVETGATDPRSSLLTFPQNSPNGYLQGIYPALIVQNGDRFQSTISCEFNAADCLAVYRLDYQIDSGPILSYWTYAEQYDGQTSNVDIDLSQFAGQNVKFILTVLSNGSAGGDRALWIAPRISRLAIGGGPEPATVIPTETVTPTPTVPSPIDTETPTPTNTETPTPAFTETPTPTSTITP